jgi:hypothetical protein
VPLVWGRAVYGNRDLPAGAVDQAKLPILTM